MGNASCNIYAVHGMQNIQDTVQNIIEEIRKRTVLSEEKEYEIKLVLNELIVNSLQYAQVNSNTPVSVGTKIRNGAVSFIISDKGKGFEYQDYIMNMENHKRVIREDELMKENGRGLLLVSAFADELKYNRKGNKVFAKILL